MCCNYLTLYTVLFILGPALDCNVISPILTKSLQLLSRAVSRSTDHMLHTDQHNLKNSFNLNHCLCYFILVLALLLYSHVNGKLYAHSYSINKKVRRVYQIYWMIDAKIISFKNVPMSYEEHVTGGWQLLQNISEAG
jgi:hypothetical protein